MASAPVPQVTWGEPGSFLLPRALRESTDTTPVPAPVRGFLPSLSPEEPLGTATFPSDWVLLPAVARRLVEFLRETGLLDLPVVPPSFDTAALTGLNSSPTLRAEGWEDRSPVLARAHAGMRRSSLIEVLQETTFRILFRAAGNDAERFMIACGEVDAILADVEADIGGGHNSSDADDGPRTTGGILVAARAAHRHEPPEPVSAAMSGTALFLPADLRGPVSALPDDQWATLFDALPMSPATRVDLMKRGGGDHNQVRQLLLDLSSADLGDIPGFRAASQRNLIAALRWRLPSLRVPVDESSDPFLGARHRTMLSRLSDTGWSALLGQLPTSIGNALLRHAGGADEVRQLLLRATGDELTGINFIGTGQRSTLKMALIADLESGRYPSSDPSHDAGGPRPVPAVVTVQPVAPARPALPVDASLIRSDDPRFERLVRPGPTLSEALEHVHPVEANELVTRLVAQLESMRVETLEEEGAVLLAAALNLPTDHPRVAALALRYGLTGHDPAPMADVARVLGVTRARVGQLSQQLTARLPHGEVWAPVCEQIALLVEAVIPCGVSELSGVMRDAGLTSIDWSVAALVRVAGLFGRTLDLLDVDGMAVAADSAPAIRQIVKTARRLSERNGAATIGSVALEIASERTVTAEITEGLVRDVLSSRDDVSWLSDSWFWTHHGASRNRLVNTSLRILAARRPQRLSSMAEGVRRYFAWRNSTGAVEFVAPPDAILEAFYRRHPAFVIDRAAMIDTAEPVDIEILGPEKATLVSILRAQRWPVMSRPDLIGACVAEGMNIGTAGVFLTYAECVENFGPNAWGLRGADIPAHVVEDVQKKARRESRSFATDWHDSVTAGGNPWCVRRISPGMLYSGVIASAWSTNLPEGGRFALIDGTDGETEGALRRSGTFLHGLMKFFRKNQPRIGDHLRIVLYRSGGYVVAEVGGHELTSDPEDWE